ncbi:MAG TPA: glycosyltransferase family 9 protein [Candidatus Angelobacter sp.]|nr:glycosyltransferase family 9 protein [Candidatus Angelobacter sp.]
MKILILKPSSLGDVIQALPVLRLLRLHFPRGKIYWWIDAALRELIEGDPDLDGIFLFERRRWSSPFHWNELLASIRRMREMKFDWVIDLQSLARSGAFAWLANGGLTVGLDDSREGARGFYDVAVPRPAFFAHAVDWYLEALSVLRVPVHWNFTWLPTRIDAAAAVKARWKVDSGRWIVLQPGARWVNKRWPGDHFAELVRLLARDYKDLNFVILGSKDDATLGQRIAVAEPKRCLDLTGRTSLLEMIEWIRSSELVVTNDTGPMHAAAALGTAVVAMFGPTEPRRTGPFGQIHRTIQLTSLPCVPCLKDTCAYDRPLECLRSVTPAMVRAEVSRHLAELERARLPV